MQQVDKITNTQVVIIISVFFVIFLISVIVLGLIFIKSNNNSDTNVSSYSYTLSPGDILITQNKNYFNNANFIYINKKIKIADKEILIKKILLDSLATIFYFEEPIGDLQFTIKDNHKTEYKIDDVYYDMKKTNFKEKDNLRFKPFKSGTTEFLLIITNEKGVFEKIRFVFKKPFVDTEVKIINTQTTLNDSGLNFKFEKAELSSASSTIFFSLSSQDASTTYTSISNGQNIRLYEDESRVAFTNSKKMDSVFRVDFDPLKNLTSQITVELFNIYVTNPIDMVIDASKFKNLELEPFVLYKGDHMILFDNLSITEDKAILSIHAENTLTHEREECILDIALIKNDGTVFDGDTRAIEEGADTFFYEPIYNLDDYKFQIKSYATKAQSIKVAIDPVDDIVSLIKE